ncbi:unnamed protein product [Absidia cylindrospora]
MISSHERRSMTDSFESQHPDKMAAMLILDGDLKSELNVIAWKLSKSRVVNVINGSVKAIYKKIHSRRSTLVGTRLIFGSKSRQLFENRYQFRKGRVRESFQMGFKQGHLPTEAPIL